MNPLYLSGFGVSLNVDRARLIAKDGFLEPDSLQERHVLQPRDPRYDSVVIDGQTGTVSLSAVKWLMRHKVPLFMLDYDGKLLSSTLPQEPINGPLKIAQIEAYKDGKRRLHIARKIIEAKTQRTLDVLGWLESRYGMSDAIKNGLDDEKHRLDRCMSIRELMMVEGRIADAYWRYLQQVLPEKFGFRSRIRKTHQMNASDPVNCLLNYGYAILESECRKALNAVGLEPTVGFLHEAKQVKSPLCYDLQEPFRWIVDVTVIGALERREFTRSDFFRMDNYNMRLKPEAAKRLIERLREKFHSTVQFQGKAYNWDKIIFLKSKELARHLLHNTTLDFLISPLKLKRSDTSDLRRRILSLS